MAHMRGRVAKRGERKRLVLRKCSRKALESFFFLGVGSLRWLVFRIDGSRVVNHVKMMFWGLGRTEGTDDSRKKLKGVAFAWNGDFQKKARSTVDSGLV